MHYKLGVLKRAQVNRGTSSMTAQKSPRHSDCVYAHDGHVGGQPPKDGCGPGGGCEREGRFKARKPLSELPLLKWKGEELR